MRIVYFDFAYQPGGVRALAGPVGPLVRRQRADERIPPDLPQLPIILHDESPF